MSTGFVGRQRELRLLQNRWESERAELLVLYGRPRVGKTALIRQFLQDKAHVYFLASRVGSHDNLEAFRQVLLQETGNPLVEQVRFDGWENAFDAFTDLVAGGERASFGHSSCLILDEFHLLCQAEPELLSSLRHWWDSRGKFVQIMLVLCSSNLTFVEEQLLSASSRLYGRRTGQLMMTPFLPWQIEEFFPGWSPLERLKAYSVFGGVPAYLSRVDTALDLRTNLKEKILSNNEYLYEEVSILLRDEFGQGHNYLSLLEAVASGAQRVMDISAKAGIPPTTVTNNLGTLQAAGLIGRELPYDEPRPERSRRALYVVLEPFIRFWCRYVQPHASLVAEERGAHLWDRFIAPDFDQHVGDVFREICRRFVEDRVESLLAGVHALRVGRLWNRELEVDLLAELSDGSVLVATCLHWPAPVGLNVLRSLREGVERTRSLEGRKKFAVFSTSGFTDELWSMADLEGVLLVDLGTVMSPNLTSSPAP